MEMPKLPTINAVIGFAMIYAGFAAFQKHIAPIPFVGQYLPGGANTATA